jgi:hypothetical protein
MCSVHAYRFSTAVAIECKRCCWPCYITSMMGNAGVEARKICAHYMSVCCSARRGPTRPYAWIPCGCKPLSQRILFTNGHKDPKRLCPGLHGRCAHAFDSFTVYRWCVRLVRPGLSRAVTRDNSKNVFVWCLRHEGQSSCNDRLTTRESAYLAHLLLSFLCWLIAVRTAKQQQQPTMCYCCISD